MTDPCQGSVHVLPCPGMPTCRSSTRWTWRSLPNALGFSFGFDREPKDHKRHEMRFLAPNENYERNAVKNQRTKQRVQRILGDCWQWESNGQCSRGDNCSFRHDVNKRGKMKQSPNSLMQQNERKAQGPEVLEERVAVVECFDGLARITSKELTLTPVKSGTLQNACSTRPRVVAGLGKSARMHIVRSMNNLVKKSPKRLMTKMQ